MSRSLLLVLVAILAMFFIGMRLDQPLLGIGFGFGLLMGALAEAESAAHRRAAPHRAQKRRNLQHQREMMASADRMIVRGPDRLFVWNPTEELPRRFLAIMNAQHPDSETASIQAIVPVLQEDAEDFWGWSAPEDDAGEYGRLLAQRDQLVGEGVDPADLLVPDPPGTGGA